MWRSPNVVAAAAALTPASLSPKVWIEADPATLYTDAGTTLVSADGQAVQQVNDKSGNARNLSQATSTKRPLYHTGSGKPYLDFDGVDDFMASASYAPQDASGQHWYAISAYIANSATTPQMLALLNDGSSAISRAACTSGNSQCVATSSGGTDNPDSGPAITSATPFVMIAAITSTTVEVFLNNVSDGATTLTITPSGNSGILYLASNVGALWFAGMRLYGLVQGSGTLSSTDRANLQAYMAALHP